MIASEAIPCACCGEDIEPGEEYVLSSLSDPYGYDCGCADPEHAD